MLKRFLTDTEQRALLHAAHSNTDPLAQRDYQWMRLMIETGARVAELAAWTVKQAEAALASGWLVVPPVQRKANSKGVRKGHQYLVTQPVAQCLRTLLMMQAQHAAPLDGGAPAPLIRGREDGAHLSVRSYQARIKLWAAEAGIDLGVSPHWLRHTRGVNIIHRSRAANPLKVVQEALGHATIASTGIYTQLRRDEYVQALHATAGGRMTKKQARAAAAGLGGA